MKGKHRTTAAGSITRLTVLVACLGLLTTFRGGDQRAQAQAEDLSPSAIIYTENFGAVTIPAIPVGWTTSQTGTGTTFRTVGATANNPTTSVFTSNPATAGSAELVSPSIAIGAGSVRLSFRHIFITETQSGYDGGVLEISIGGGAFQDIVTAGGTFTAGGYVQAIQPDAAGNPLIGRQAWTGASTEYITSIVNLPAAAANQNVRFKWRYGTDEIFGGQGWWVDDIQVDEGAVPTSGGISYTFSNPSPISIPDGAPGVPYPSVINVSNVPNQLAKVTVKLNSLSHTFPSDIDILLVGPQGQTSVLMSDVGGGTAVNGITLTLDDAAGVSLPTSALTTGTYKPTNSGLTDPFPAPAPTQSGSSVLSVFNATNPNGAWRLFVVDDVGADIGSIGMGWTLTLTAAISGQNTGGIAIPESGPASPYPSEINIADHNNPISRVQVNLNNFSHASPDDVDILLMSPSGRSVILMSDAGGSAGISNLNLSFDDLSAASLPDSTAITSGTYRPTDHEPGDAFPAPAGAVTGRTLSSLNGTVANGAWKLFVVDDSGNNVGNVEGGWSILVGTTAGIITVEGGNVASMYPSEISISGLPGSITKATVSIQNFSHLAPDDLDILLVGPDGRRIVLMSDAGGTTEVGGLNMTFDDAAPAAVPDSAPLVSGAFRPANYEPGDVFPAPAPTGPVTGTTLNAFYGGAPNGIWRLYITGDGGTSFGSIAGSWNVTLQTSTSACLFSVSPSVQAFPVNGGSGNFNVTQPTGCGWTASTTDSFISILSGTSGGGNGAVGFSVAANQGPARTGIIQVSNGVTIRSFQVQQPSGCPLSVNQSVINFTAAGGTGNVAVSAGGACSWQGSTTASWIQVTSSPQSGNGALTFNVQPNTSGVTRTSTIDVGSWTLTVNQTAPRTTPFDFDGDGRTDVSVFRPSTGTWWISPSSQPGTAVANQFGITTDRIAPADYDGDDKTDIAVYRDGTWYVLASSNASVSVSSWGTAGDIPVPADYNNDGRAQLAIFRPSTGTWWIANANGTFSSIAFGTNGDIPTPGDYSGDGKADISVYRAAASAGQQGTWWIINSSGGAVSATAFGVQGDVPVPGDYDGDGRDNIAVYRPSTGFWYRSTDASRNYDAVQWGITADRPVAGDYDGDGKADPAVVRSGSSVVWYILGSTSGAQAHQFGSPGDQPAPGAYIP